MPSYRPLTLRVLDQIGPPDENGCWPWIGSKCRGYGQVRMPKSRKMARVIRLVLEGAIGELSPGVMACHSCDNPACVNPEHLFPGTGQDNMRDCVQKNRICRSGAPGDRKTTVSQREEIRRRYASGEPQDYLAVMFGVTQTRISQIVNGGRDRRRYRKYHSAETIEAIRNAYSRGAKQSRLARKFCLGQSTISRIVRGESGQHIINSERLSAAEGSE